jgi:sugar transferase (PEP-CTERM/EpsH1 system associated)
MSKRPLVVHLTYALDFGGLETLLVQCINGMPAHKYRHAVVCLTHYTAFADKITQPGVELFALHKPPGLGLSTHVALWKLLRRLRPAILHTYNLAAAEYAFTATLAGVPVRIHAEHGRDAGDPHGKNRKHNLLRRLLVPFIDRYVPVSGDLHHWLKTVVGIPDAKNQLIDNGVDTAHFTPAPAPLLSPGPWSGEPAPVVIGTVGRVQDVKNQAALIEAFIRLRALAPAEAARLRLVIVGDGPLRAALARQVADAGIGEQVWLAGARSDIADLMRTFSVFALPSIAEGMPVTLLEAMSCGLPVVASRVGGIPELVLENNTGLLVPPNDPQALAEALSLYVRQPALARQHGAAGRARIEARYSIAAMLSGYTSLYDALCKTKTKSREAITCAE